MKRYKHLIVDLDGVVWRGEQPLKENIEVLERLSSRDVNIIYLTNNSTRSRIEYVYRLERYGIKTSIDHVINGGYLAAEYIREKGGKKVFVIGEAGLYYEITKANLIPVTIGSPADHVVVGLDRFLTYNKIAYASKLILNGASFIATNTDNVFPVEDGVSPGAGSIVAMIKESTGKEPEMITGKPNPWVLDFIIEKYSIDPSELLIIGDRVDIDVLMGIKKGIDTLYILTGVGKPDDPEKYGVEPTYITRDLMEFYRRYRNYFPE